MDRSADSDADYARLDEYLAEQDLDGYLLDADAESSDQRYLSGFDAPDPFVTLYTPETTALLVSGLEYGRAREESRADVVRRLGDYDYRALAAEHGRDRARARVVNEFLASFDVEAVAVPARFPVATADDVRDESVTVQADRTDVVMELRATKTPAEIDHVREAQRANEAAMAAAEGLLADAAIVDGRLRHEDEPLTSERVKEEIEVTLLRHGCALDETIVACGADAAEPHNRGSGPLRANEPIVVDVFPRDKATNYHADMTRTFVRGEPDEAARAFYETTEEAFAAALAAIEPGATGADVHAAVCDVYEAAGYPTLRDDERAETGFIHSTGHGVGLDVHERPRLSEEGGELRPGHVVTVEPGLYDPEVGGVRIEDLVVVTEEGYENLTDYPKTFLL